MKRIKIRYSLICLMLMVFYMLPVNASTNDTIKQEETVIRISFPTQFGFSEMDEEGDLSGYTYDYLMKMAQRTGWKYEFVPYTSTSEGLQQSLMDLQNGTTDIIGSLVYSEELAKMYEYSTVPYGYTDFILFSSTDGIDLNMRTVFDYPNLKIALIEKATTQNQMLEDFCKERKLEYTPIYGESFKECAKLVENGEADLVIGKNVNDLTYLKPVLTFAQQPFYFAVTKEQTHLAKEIDNVISEICSIEPNFSAELYKKHFTKETDYLLALTADEIEFLQDTPAIRAVVLENHPPIQSYDKETNTFQGIAVDFLERISKECGIKFEYVPATSNDHAKQLMLEGQADIVASIPYDYSIGKSYNMLLTTPTISVPVVHISNRNQKSEVDRERLVSGEIGLLTVAENTENVKVMENIKEIFKLVDSNKYQDAYLGAYASQHYIKTNLYSNVNLTTVPSTQYKLCIGVSQNADPRIVRILEQSLACISQTERDAIIYQNTSLPVDVTFADIVKRNPLQIIGIILLVATAIIILLIITYLRAKKISKRIYQEKIKYMEIAQTDRLSKTYNNATFKTLAKEFLDNKEHTPCGTLLVCDIDDFKLVNDTYGHLVGDEVISSIGRIMKNTFRQEDLVGRLGGDEMLVLMKGLTQKELVAERCMQLLEESLEMNQNCNITLSIGGVIFHERMEFEELFKLADDILYKVKQNGKNGFKLESSPSKK